MRATLLKKIASHGSLFVSLAVSALAVVVSGSITGFHAWLSGRDLMPGLLLAMLTPAVLAPPVTYVFVRLVEQLERAEKEIAERQAQLAQVTRHNLVGEMAAGLAHELNQPLAAIAGYVEGSLRRLRALDDPPANVLEAMEKASGQARRAGGIIRWMLDFVRQVDHAKVPIGVNDIIQDLHEILLFDARGFGVELEFHLEPDPPGVLADPVQIQQVVLNLARNALDAMEGMEEGSGRLIIRTRLHGSGLVAVEVEDNGPGIETESQARIFDAFFSTKEDGLGMGLSISRTIIEDHGGTMWTDRAAGGPTVFCFTLPRAG